MHRQSLRPDGFEYPVLEYLSTLSYRTSELGPYLHEIVCTVSHLLQSDRSIVTFCKQGKGQILASSLGLGEDDGEFKIHGSLVEEVSQLGRSLIIEDFRQTSKVRQVPCGYLGYMGIPLKTVQGEVSGTICSFFRQPRHFFEADIWAVEMLAERAATAIDNYTLYQQQQKFNELLEEKVAHRTEELRITQARLVEQERLAAIGEFTAMIVHEIRNPLATLLLGLQYAQKHLLDPFSQERFSLCLSETARLQQFLSEILIYSKPQLLSISEINLKIFLEEFLEQMRELPEVNNRVLQLEPIKQEAIVQGDCNKLKQVFINLIRNACEAIEAGEVVTCRVLLKDPSYVSIEIHNGGEPISAEILPKLTEPFCSTKASGTGLGLAIVKRIVMAHKGDLCIQSDFQMGTKITVQLPLWDTVKQIP